MKPGVALLLLLLLGAFNIVAQPSTKPAQASPPPGKQNWKSEDGNISFQFDTSQWNITRRGKGGFLAAHKKQDLMLMAASGPFDPRMSVAQFAASFKKGFEEGAKKAGGNSRFKWINEPKEFGTYSFTVEYPEPSANQICYGRVLLKPTVFSFVQLSGKCADAAARKEAMAFEKAVTFTEGASGKP